MPNKSGVVQQQAKVEGLGGVFIYANDPKTLAEWYQDKLGIELADGACDGEANYYCVFAHDTVFSIKQAKQPLPAGRNQFMVNFKVDDFDGLINRLKSKGVAIDRTQDHEYGRFGWIKDLEGNPIEFWQSK